MTFPTGTVIPTTNVASPDSDPSQARADFFALITAFNQLIASANLADGVVLLNGSGRVPVSYLPSTWSIQGDIALQPSSGLVSINNVLRLYQTYTEDLGSTVGTETPVAGDVVYLVDGDAGQPCIGCYDGTDWRVVRFMTQVGNVGAQLSATATLVAEAD
jgi:hypothetical protein